tara:strand:+ start:16185 stop:16310 length:126 start_codon:yes stop_codon:yes gene_type:complete
MINYLLLETWLMRHQNNYTITRLRHGLIEDKNVTYINLDLL